MRIKIHNKFSRRLWHYRFAWLPVKIGITLVWLEEVRARRSALGEWEYELSDRW